MSNLKVLRRKVFKVKIFLKAISIYWRSISYPLPKVSSATVVFFDVSKPETFGRYFYIFAKYFLIAGHEVFLKRSLRSIYYMCSDVDTSFVFKESQFYLGKPVDKSKVFRINDSMLNPNYFEFLFVKTQVSTSYHVPIGFHPYIYFKEYWKIKQDSRPRFKSLFLAGNFSKTYSNDYNEKFFGVTNRNHMKQTLEKFGLLNEVDFTDLEQFVNSLNERSIYLVDRMKGVPIHPKDIFEILSRFEFFFALPGMYMPLCHNIIEAMSVGTVPFLQEGYAITFKPALENGVNCITFSGIDDLKNRIEFLFSLDCEAISKLRLEVRKYYKEHLSAESVVERVSKGKFSTIYLMAEKYSVDHLRKIMSK